MKYASFPIATRITVVTPKGGRGVDWYDAFPDGMEIHLQDGGHTLKVFPWDGQFARNDAVERGHWEYARRTTDGEGDLWPLGRTWDEYWGSYEVAARGLPRGWEVVRRWVPDPTPWEATKEGEPE